MRRLEGIRLDEETVLKTAGLRASGFKSLAFRQYGLVAQLGEHCCGMAEVMGSIPI